MLLNEVQQSINDMKEKNVGSDELNKNIFKLSIENLQQVIWLKDFFRGNHGTNEGKFKC